jgi:hypothetical protein
LVEFFFVFFLPLCFRLLLFLSIIFLTSSTHIDFLINCLSHVFFLFDIFFFLGGFTLLFSSSARRFSPNYLLKYFALELTVKNSRFSSENEPYLNSNKHFRNGDYNLWFFYQWSNCLLKN